MSAFVFNIACPRCDTVIKVLLKKYDYECSRCQFKVVIDDQGNLLEAFKNREEEDLDFSESPIREKQSHMDHGIKLTFFKPTDGGEEHKHITEKEIDINIDEDDFGNKTANTQIIRLTFDPAKYLDQMKKGSDKWKTKTTKISLRQVIKNAESAKPPIRSRQELLIRNLTIVVTVVLLMVIIFALGKNS